jgi:glycosyltransferase involved in cell wall biosynthesis
MARICLSMIVRDDAERLAGVLSSLVPVVDAFVVADCGSTDGSARIVRDVLGGAGLPGLVADVPFLGFAQARNRALDLCRRSDLAFDYILIGDADHRVSVDDPSFREALWAPGHAVRHDARVSFEAVRLVGRAAPARFRGAAHEVLDAPGDVQPLSGLRFVAVGGGDPTVRARRDIELMTQAQRTETDAMMRARYSFYLGNDYRALGDQATARRHYLARARMGFWSEEVYCARLYAARCGEAMGLPAADMVQEYAALNNDMMHRAEAMHAIARICRLNGWWEQAFVTADAAARIEKPAGALFLEDWIYDWGAADELAVAAYWTGRTDLCVDLCDQLLASGWLGEADTARVRRNRALASGSVAAAAG